MYPPSLARPATTACVRPRVRPSSAEGWAAAQTRACAVALHTQASHARNPLRPNSKWPGPIALRRVRPESERLLKPCPGLVELALVQRVMPRLLCASAKSGRRARLARNVPPLRRAEIQVVVDFGKIRLESDRLLIPCRRLVELVLPHEDDAQIVLGSVTKKRVYRRQRHASRPPRTRRRWHALS